MSGYQKNNPICSALFIELINDVAVFCYIFLGNSETKQVLAGLEGCTLKTKSMPSKPVITHKSILQENTRSSIHSIEKKLDILKGELLECTTQIEKVLKEQTNHLGSGQKV